MKCHSKKFNSKYLRDKLRKYELYISGSKTQLIDRIAIYEASPFKPHYSLRTITHLKILLRKRGLRVSGLKEKLINRLDEADRLIISSRSISSSKFLTGIDDVDRVILLNLDDKSLLNACMSNKRSADISTNDNFWNQRIQHIYNVDLSDYKKENTYKEVYRILRENKDSKHSELEEVSKRGYFPLVKQLIEEDKLKDHLHNNGVLGWAARNGHLQIVKYLIEEAEVKFHITDELALFWAAHTGQLTILKYLIGAGAEYNYRILRTAATDGHLSIVKYLIEELDVDIDDDDKNYSIAVAAENGHISIVKYLNEIIKVHTWLDFSLSMAAQHGHLHVVKYLVEETGANSHDGEALNLAVIDEHISVIKYLIEEAGVNTNKISKFHFKRIKDKSIFEYIKMKKNER